MKNGSNLLAQFQTSAEALATNPHLRTETHDSAITVKPSGGAIDHKVLILSGIHGNEIGGIAVAIEMMKGLSQNPAKLGQRQLTFALGNVEAIKQGQRFVDKDLNRMFGTKTNTFTESPVVTRIESLIQQCDFLIDLHQTVQPSMTPFFVTPFDLASMKIIESLAADFPIVTYKGKFSADGLSANLFARTLGKLSFTFEMGEMGIDPQQIQQTLPMVEQAALGPLNVDTSKPLGEAIQKRFFVWDQVIERAAGIELVPGLRNFSLIQQGEVLAYHDGKPLTAKNAGFVLFPKYGALAQVSAELVRTVRALTPAELQAWLA